MTGTLPGVGVSSRRKLKPNHPSFTSSREFKPSMSTANYTTTTAMDLDETALRARHQTSTKSTIYMYVCMYVCMYDKP